MLNRIFFLTQINTLLVMAFTEILHIYTHIYTEKHNTHIFNMSLLNIYRPFSLSLVPKQYINRSFSSSILMFVCGVFGCVGAHMWAWAYIYVYV